MLNNRLEAHVYPSDALRSKPPKEESTISFNSVVKQNFLLLLVISLFLSGRASASATQERISMDLAREKPIVIHVSVALADNKHQWIAPVHESIGNGQDARSNLYWGARYGLKTFLVRDAGWKVIKQVATQDKRILESLIFTKLIARNGHQVKVYLIADAWDGRYISETIGQFLRFSAGSDVITLDVDNQLSLDAGGAAHLKVYIGHDALMDFFGLKDKSIQNPEKAVNALESDAIVLACKSKAYFEPRLKAFGSHPLVLTSGLMAPEAYSLDAAVTTWVMGGGDNEVRKSAAAAYAKYQKISPSSARALFNVEP